MKTISLILRGHIRDAFVNKNLIRSILYLKKSYNVKIFICTWDNSECNKNNCWREINNDNYIVTKEVIIKYFKQIQNDVKIIKILNENDIIYNGNIDGVVSKSKISKKGWKNMWFGNYVISKELYDMNDNSDYVINMRLDIFGLNHYKLYNNLYENEISFNYFDKLIEEYDKGNNNICFLNNDKFIICVDNIYISDSYYNYKLSYLFHYYLDDLEEILMDTIYQEELVFNLVYKYPKLDILDINKNINYNYKKKEINKLDNDYDYLVVGCGLSGCVIAERIATILHKKVLIIDKRKHIGGNCYDYKDSETNIRINKYGAHIFHTNNEKVWNYITKFDEWERWEHKVLSYVDEKYVPIPVNITTVNTLCSENIKTPDEMNEWLRNNQVKYNTINNSEDMAKSRIGNELYDKMVKDYTFKQWNKYPNELDKSVLERIPIRNNFDTRYFSDKYQALPKHGYTHFFEKILNNDLIQVELNTDFFDFKTKNNLYNKTIIYTGPIDHYYSSLGMEKLEYRGIDFKIERKKNMNYFQPNSVVNYPSKDVPYTRIIEYKHFLNQKSPHTIYVSETTNNDNNDPYYPVLNEKNINLYNKYKNLAEKEKKIHFIGRLANFKYFNMDQAILNALEYFDKNLNNKH